jgi:hypothetical protein
MVCDEALHEPNVFQCRGQLCSLAYPTAAALAARDWHASPYRSSLGSDGSCACGPPCTRAAGLFRPSGEVCTVVSSGGWTSELLLRAALTEARNFRGRENGSRRSSKIDLACARGVARPRRDRCALRSLDVRNRHIAPEQPSRSSRTFMPISGFWTCLPAFCGGTFPTCGGTCGGGKTCVPVESVGGPELCVCATPSLSCGEGTCEGGLTCPSGKACTIDGEACSCEPT